MSPLLEVKSVSKSYGARKVTDDLSFSLAEGETLGVLGPNGAGKSTMFDLITGDVRPDAGHVHYCSETSPNAALGALPEGDRPLLPTSADSRSISSTTSCSSQ